MQASVEFMLIASAVALLSLSVVSLYSRQLFTQNRALIAIINKSLPGISSPNYATPSYNASLPVSYSASIAQRNEMLAYSLSAPSPILNLSEWSHCTSFGFFGHPYDVGGQCGTYNAWMYKADYGRCPSTAAFCIVQTGTGYGTASTGSSRDYIYNISLLISSPSGPMRATLVSGENGAAIALNNRTVGYARVVNASSSDPFQQVNLINNGTAYGLINVTAYEQYQQAKSIAYSTLRFYNGTSVDGATQGVIQQSIGSFITDSENLRNSRAGSIQCRVAAGEYVCKAAFPFSYIIDANISSSFGAVNQTLYYLGSVIRIHSR